MATPDDTPDLSPCTSPGGTASFVLSPCEERGQGPFPSHAELAEVAKMAELCARNSTLRKTVAEQGERLGRCSVEAERRDAAVLRLRQSNRALMVFAARTVFRGEEVEREAIEEAWLGGLRCLECSWEVVCGRVEVARSVAQALRCVIEKERLEATLIEQVACVDALSLRLAAADAEANSLRDELAFVKQTVRTGSRASSYSHSPPASPRRVSPRAISPRGLPRGF